MRRPDRPGALDMKKLPKIRKEVSPDEVLSFAKTLDIEDLQETIQEWVDASSQGGSIYRNLALGIGVAFIGICSIILGLFVVLVPSVYGVGGWMLYRKQGWNFFQVGVGGVRFVALNGVAWFLYSVFIAIQLFNLAFPDPLLTFNAFMVGGLSYVLMCVALFAYYPPNASGRGATVAVQTPQDDELDDSKRYATPTFNRQLQRSVLMRTDSKSVSFFWWVFIGMQASIVFTAFVVTVVSVFSQGNPLVRMLTTSLVMWTQGIAIATTHALGGKWRHIETSYSAFQPGRGGFAYVSLQIIGWGSFGLGIVAGFLDLTSQAAQVRGKTPLLIPGMMPLCGCLGSLAELFIIASLFVYKDMTNGKALLLASPRHPNVLDEQNAWWNKALLSAVKFQIALLNALFGPRDAGAFTRQPKCLDPDAHLACDARWEAEVLKTCPRTGDSYLIVGNGFVGKRIVNELLARGETRIRVFDVVPLNPWQGDSRVQFIRGDVTKASEIGLACEGVDTVYSTFAIIRFMERLEHQAFLSYHVNVYGTEVLLEACRRHNIKRLIVTSSSHATTDEHSEPRFDRDETAPLLSRQEAHNHYGWTKAMADQMALDADGSKLANGQDLQVVVVRPCSGVFGADDRLSFERIMDMGIVPGIGAKAIMDWVPVQSVVQGHLLAERALQQGVLGVRGEAFCISNDDPTSMEDFWWLAIKYIRQLAPHRQRRLHIDFLYLPEGIFWALAYVSELNAWLFRGKTTLGRDLDTLTPAMLSTATMSYTYTSAKARRILGYKPVFSLDEAIQRAIHEYDEAHFIHDHGKHLSKS